MDDAALFDLARGTALNGLDRVGHLLDVVAVRERSEDLLQQALVPGMFDLAGQLQITVGFAYRCVMPVLGRDVDAGDEAAGLDEIKALAAQARADLLAITAHTFAGASTRRVMHEAGDAALDQSARDYVVDFAIPNLWFHLSMAYAILRANGVVVGKADFDGLHAYQHGFSFV